MQKIIIRKIAVIPAVALLFALSPFSKAHADLVGSQWSVKYYTPTDSGLSAAPTTPVGDLVGDFSQKLEYCISEERYNTTVVFKEYTYYEEVNGINVLRTDHYGVLPDGQLVKVLKYEMDDGRLNNVKISPSDAERLGYSVDVTPKNPGIVSYSKNCTIENYGQSQPEIQPYSEELAVEDCPAGQTVDGVVGGRTQRIGNIPNYFSYNADYSQQLYFKFASDGTYSPYNESTYSRVPMWGKTAINEVGLIERFGGTYQAGSEGACKTPVTEPVLTSESKQETRPLACDVGETGIIWQYQNYVQWSDGTRSNESGWITYYNTCTKIAEPDYSVPLHFDHDQYIYEDCPAGQTVGGFEFGSTQRQGRVEIWSETDKKGVMSFSIKNLKSGEFTPINLSDYAISEPPYMKMPASFMYTFNGVWTPGFEEACKTPITYTYESEYQTVDCPADMTGSISQSRLVKKGSDGSVLPLIDWYTIMSSCQLPEPEQPVEPEQPTEPETPVTPTEPSEPETPVTPEPSWEDAGNASVSFTCPAGQTIGSVMGNGNVRKGLIPVVYKGTDFALTAADGSLVPVQVQAEEDGTLSIPSAVESDVATYGGKWVAGSEEKCGEPSQFQAMTDWKTETVACAEAQTGHITYDYNRTWDFDAKNNITKNDSGWISKVRENTCKDLESTLLEEEEVELSEQCPEGQYGTISVKGKYVTYGLENKKFIETDRVSHCVAELDQFEKVTQTRECPEGQVGQINEFMMKAVDTKGNESFPYGKTWVQESNTCTNPVSADSESSGLTDTAKGLLSNQTLKASDNVNLDKLLNYLNVVQDVSPSPDYKLNIVLDTFDNINLEKIQAVATKWKSVSGGKVVLGDAPRFAESYIGYNGITKSNMNEFVITAAYYSNGNITVTAKQVGKMKNSKNIIFNVPFAKI